MGGRGEGYFAFVSHNTFANDVVSMVYGGRGEGYSAFVFYNTFTNDVVSMVYRWEG
jgi:hypothetical protein